MFIIAQILFSNSILQYQTQYNVLFNANISILNSAETVISALQKPLFLFNENLSRKKKA